MRTYNTYLYNELNVIGNTSAKDYWEERCPIRASGCILRDAWEGLGASWEDLGASWDGLGAILGPLGAVLGSLGVVSWWHVGTM